MKMEIFMKGNLFWIKEKGKENLFIKMETFIQEIL